MFHFHPLSISYGSEGFRFCILSAGVDTENDGVPMVDIFPLLGIEYESGAGFVFRALFGFVELDLRRLD